ncbi:MAG: zeta toxin family protein [Candidatus Rokubacteria bacterium]|nr:zeta toxin family protein [Candidatus Rokubacteria bacterium]
MADAAPRPCIYVIAGTNGAGKSSIGGATLLREGAEYFDPDAATRRILARSPGATLAEANSAAWNEGRRLLERAIAERLSFAFETTLGGTTITGLLERALSSGIGVRIWYVGLNSAELHVARVRARVAKGGHDVPEATIRDRYNRGRLNLIRLLPRLTELRLHDNSEEADPSQGVTPRPRLLLHCVGDKVVSSCSLALTPEWARPIMAAALTGRVTVGRPRRLR